VPGQCHGVDERQEDWRCCIVMRNGAGGQYGWFSSLKLIYTIPSKDASSASESSLMTTSETRTYDVDHATV
jgi:hypothetical protein